MTTRTIAAAVGRTEANCRQILRRAREHVHAARPRFTPSARKQTDLLARFVQAATNGDLDGLVALLASDAELHTDGGGKAPALPNLVHGATSIARAILGGMAKFAPKTFVTRLVEINGEPGFVSYFNGKPAIALVLHISDDNVQTIFAISNPAKLARLPGAPSERRPVAASQARDAESSGASGKGAQLSQLREDVDDPPGLGDSAVHESTDDNLVIRDGLAGWWQAHVLALVGPSDRIAGDDFVSLRDQILDRNMKVGEGPMEPAEHLFQQFRAGRFNRQWRTD